MLHLTLRLSNYSEIRCQHGISDCFPVFLNADATRNLHALNPNFITRLAKWTNMQCEGERRYSAQVGFRILGLTVASLLDCEGEI